MGHHLVDPGNTVGGGGEQTVLAVILQLDPIYVVANLSEQEVLKVRENIGQRSLTLAELLNIPVEVAHRERDRLSLPRNHPICGAGF